MRMNTKISRGISAAKTGFKGVSKVIMAGAAGAALLAGNVGNAFKNTAGDIKTHASNKTVKKTEEVIVMKKSTVVGLLVVLAAIAGALGALYMYVLRREKELDEYEQLLFSEDFDDEMDYGDYDDYVGEVAPEAPAAPEAKTEKKAK